MKPYSIRVAKESDIDCLIDMKFALQTHLEKSNPDIWRLSDEGKEQFKEQFIELFSDPDVQVLLALNDKGEAIGMVVGRIHRNPKYIPNISGSVELLFVKEEYRKRGVGTELVLTLCEFFSSQGAEDISVRYVVGNREAEEFWTRLGFQPRIVTAGVKQQRILEKISTAKHERWAT
ncbi:MAG: GNAT family N-acetyltransferase, partial [Candidatus Poribacteria bacterium]